MTVYTPLIFPADSDSAGLKNLTNIKQKEGVLVYDTIESQLKELVKTRNPKTNFKTNPEKYQQFIEDYLSGRSIGSIGNWVFYPWKNTLVRVLEKDEYFELRTNRNKYKITEQEQDLLAQKSIGVIGLSVGQTVAITMAMENIFGEIRLADFDEIELSNLNRLRTGVQNLGENKAVVVAREIAEIDPYLTVKVFEEGLNENNIDAFFTEGGILDALVEECDGLDIKIVARQKAKEFGIPVVMETNDRAMLDIERFDEEPSRPILHGLVNNLDVEVLKSLKTNEDKVPYMLDMIGIDDTSVLLRASMLEIEQSLTTWPQLASSVTFGGGLVCDVVRRILLGEQVMSGRFYHDIENQILKSERAPAEINPGTEPAPLSEEAMRDLAFANKIEAVDHLSQEEITYLVSMAHTAPSRGNNQPWKWYYSSGVLYLFMDEHYSNPNYQHYETMVAFGAATENLKLAGGKKGITVHWEYVFEACSPLVARYTFKADSPEEDKLASHIEGRGTNRMLGDLQPIPSDAFTQMETSVADIPGARLVWIDEKKNELGDILASVERLRIMTTEGHREFVDEIRWTAEEAETTKDGVDLRTIDLTETEKAGLWVAKDPKVMDQLRDWNLGTGFKTMMKKAIDNTERIGFITMPTESRVSFFEGGRALERSWLKATELNLGFHPISPSTFIFSKLKADPIGHQFRPYTNELLELRNRFMNLLQLSEKEGAIFLFRLFKGKDIQTRALRRDLSKHFYIDDTE